MHNCRLKCFRNSLLSYSYIPQWNVLLRTTLWSTFSHVSLNIYLMYLKQPWYVLRFLLMHNSLYGITCNLHLLMFWREENESNDWFGVKWEVWRHRVSSHCNQKQERRCYSKTCSRKELLSPFHWRFVQPGHIPAPCTTMLQSKPCSPQRWVQAGITLGVTRCLCKQAAGLSSRQQQESSEYKKGQNENTFCNHSNPEILR